jgi:hypothetical protein
MPEPASASPCPSSPRRASGCEDRLAFCHDRGPLDCSRPAASCMRQRVRYAIGAAPTSAAKRAVNRDRDTRAWVPRSGAPRLGREQLEAAVEKRPRRTRGAAQVDHGREGGDQWMSFAALEPELSTNEHGLWPSCAMANPGVFALDHVKARQLVPRKSHAPWRRELDSAEEPSPQAEGIDDGGERIRNRRRLPVSLLPRSILAHHRLLDGLKGSTGIIRSATAARRDVRRSVWDSRALPSSTPRSHIPQEGGQPSSDARVRHN